MTMRIKDWLAIGCILGAALFLVFGYAVYARATSFAPFITTCPVYYHMGEKCWVCSNKDGSLTFLKEGSWQEAVSRSLEEEYRKQKYINSQA